VLSVSRWMQVKATLGQAYPSSSIWWGEGASEFHSGLPGMTNGFEDAIFSAAQIGALAQLGFGAWCRSTLFGGFYELLDHANNFQPNPTWWLGALLKRRIFGVPSASGSCAPHACVRTFNVTSTKPELLVFVFTVGSRSNAVALLVNLQK
jgi:hypothetical protein